MGAGVVGYIYTYFVQTKKKGEGPHLSNEFLQLSFHFQKINKPRKKAKYNPPPYYKIK